MIKAIIVEDEASGRNTLLKMLEDFSSRIYVAGTAESAQAGIKLILEHKPDLVFLDIEMPYLNGFEMLEQIPERQFDVIFTTAYDQYAIKAFRFSATDYLLKPYEMDELDDAIKKIEQKRFSGNRNPEEIDVLLRNIRELKKNSNRLALPTSDGLIFVEVKRIIRCESDTNYTRFFIEDAKPVIVSRTLREFEELLDTHDFIRVHHSHLVNINHIKRYIKGEGGVVIMSDNSEVEVSRRKKDIFLSRLKQM